MSKVFGDHLPAARWLVWSDVLDRPLATHMHLHDLLERSNKVLEVSDGVVPSRRQYGGDLYLGVLMPGSSRSELRIRRASEFPHISGQEDIGLLCQTDAKLPVSIAVAFESPSGRVSRTTTLEPRSWQPLRLPNMLDLVDPFEVADLVISSEGEGGDVFIASSGRTPRDALYRLAVGVGVEIGPGPNPQILSRPGVDVTYVEEMPASEWTARYGADASHEAWSKPGYVIGKAHALPVSDHSLDFVFSSHVVEHLYNPLGHFEHWRRKLKPGGLVLGVVPSTEGTKDMVRPSTSMLRLVEEYRTGRFELPLSAYERWVRETQPSNPRPEVLAKRHFDDKLSIHVHAYDRTSIQALMSYCTTELGYSSHRMFFKRNTKDFVFALRAAD